MSDAIEPAFCSAVRTTLVGSSTPALTRSSYSLLKALNPKLIVCDEPTSALDHETGHRVMELLREVALKEERTLVIVTHDARIFEFADRIAQMDDGRIMRVEKVESVGAAT